MKLILAKTPHVGAMVYSLENGVHKLLGHFQGFSGADHAVLKQNGREVVLKAERLWSTQ